MHYLLLVLGPGAGWQSYTEINLALVSGVQVQYNVSKSIFFYFFAEAPHLSIGVKIKFCEVLQV